MASCKVLAGALLRTGLAVPMEPLDPALTPDAQASGARAGASSPAASPSALQRALLLAHPGAPRAWRPAPLYWLAAGVHVAGAVTWLARPSLWPWALGAMAADHVLNFGFSFVPGTTLLGPCVTTLPAAARTRGEVALTFDDGPDPEATPRILDLLDARGAHATFFCVGEPARTQPRLLRDIVARGHAVENHSLAHSPLHGFYGLRRLRREIEQAQRVIADLTLVPPIFYRPPYGVRTPMTEPVLSALGLHCVAWSVRSLDTVDRNEERVARRVTARLAPGAIVLLHDRAVARQRGPNVALRVLSQILDAIAARGLRAVTLRAAFAD